MVSAISKNLRIPEGGILAMRSATKFRIKKYSLISEPGLSQLNAPQVLGFMINQFKDPPVIGADLETS
jgi:hypothetical protein